MRSLLLVMALVFVVILFRPPAVMCQTIELPLTIAAPRPAYPVMALAKKISGTVLVDVEVNTEGNVVKADAVSGPAEILRDMAKAAARGWQFKPPQSVVGAFSVRLTFIFHDDSFVAPQRKPDFTSPYQVEIVRPPSQF